MKRRTEPEESRASRAARTVLPLNMLLDAA
jgi:hypothetical protein